MLCCLGRENGAQSNEHMRLLASRDTDTTSSWNPSQRGSNVPGLGIGDCGLDQEFNERLSRNEEGMNPKKLEDIKGD